MTRRILSLFQNLFRKRAVEQELNDELRSALEILTQEKMKQGLSQPVARREALIELGGIEQVKEQVRAVRVGRILEDVARDVRFAFRTLCKSPGFTAVAVLTLALGIAFTTAAFSVAVGVLWNSLPYKGAERMISFSVADPVQTFPLFLPVSQFLMFRKSPVLDDAVAWDSFPMHTKFNGLPEAVRAGWFTPNAFRFYGVRTLVGTPFTHQPLALGGEPPKQAVLSWNYWQSHFGGSRNVIGKSVELDDRLYTITGVLPERFAPLYPIDAQLYVPLPLTSNLNSRYAITGRLKPGVSPAAAAAALEPLLRQFAEQTPTHFPSNFRLQVKLLQGELEHRFGETLSMVFATALLLLAIACLNVSVLLLARGTTRKHEFAIRTALGAGRGRLFRQLLTESLFLAVAGGCLGVAASYGLLHMLPRLMPSGELPQAAQIQLSIPVLVFAILVSVACGILFGIAPAFRFGRGQGDLRIEIGTRGAAGDRSTRQLHSMLMIAQVAATLVMMAAAAVAVSTVLRLHAARLGFDPKDLTSFSVFLAEGTFTTWPARTRYYARLRDEAATVAGVKSAALSAGPLPPVSDYIIPIRIQNGTETGHSATLELVSRQFFQTLKVPLLRGRIWTASEVTHAAKFAVINRSMARRYWPTSNPIGQVVTSDGLRSRSVWMLQAPTNDGSVQIIGVVGDTPNDGLLKPALPTLYVPYTLLAFDSIDLIVRARRGFAGAIVHDVRRAVARVNGNQPLNPVHSAEQHLRKQGWLSQQFLALLFSLFAFAAGILSAIGIYSVVSYSVSQRRKEYGIRMALGASRLDILWTSTKIVALNLGIGLIAGAVVSAALSRLMTRWTKLSHLSLPILILATVLLIVVGLAATLLPAMRACNMKPMDALRLDQ